MVITCVLPSFSSALIGLSEGDTPKGIVLKDINGNEVNVTPFFGKQPLIIVFWELTPDKSFINYSLDELLFLNQFYEKYKNQTGLEIYAVYAPEEDSAVTEEEIVKVKNLITINKIKYPVLIDNGFRTFRDYGVIALPSTVMVDKTGKIKFIYPSFPMTARAVFSVKMAEITGIAPVIKKEDVKSKEGKVARHDRLYNYAVQMFKKGLTQQALSPLNKSLEMAPEFPDAHNLMGIILWKTGDFEGAKQEFMRAIDLGKSYMPARFNYALLLLESEKYSEAEELLKSSIKLDNTLAEAHYALGILYKNTKREESAMEELNTAIDLYEKTESGEGNEIKNPDVFNKISTLFVLSELYNNKGNTKQALTLLQRAAEVALGLDIKQEKKYLHRSKELLVYE